MKDGRVGLHGSARLSLWLGALLLGSVPAAVVPATPAFAAAESRGETIDAFYQARGGQPLWFASGIVPRILVDLLRSADADGLDPDDYRVRELEQAIREAGSSDIDDVSRADRLLSRAFVDYVRDLKRTPRVDMIWVDPELRPAAPSPRKVLENAAASPSIESYLSGMRWMHPIYAGLRMAIADGAADPIKLDLLRLNLERARALPAGTGRYIVVNATAADLTMYEEGKAVDSMRVVVGKPINPTPMMAALIRFTSLNPYWNVPPDLAAERVAPGVVKEGLAYLKAKGYQLLSSWDSDAELLDPATVDWEAVAAGTKEVRLRQLPGPHNAMGKMKFMFPNAQGIYLHDTPQKELLTEASRMFSGGCIRLEDAPRLARWLYGGNAPSTQSAQPEQRVDLPTPVPVYITYLTAIPDAGHIAYLPDVYNRDGAAMAQLGASSRLAGR